MNQLIRLATMAANGWVIAIMLIIITVLHLTTRADALGVHELLRRLYYIPIILSAYRYGIGGGFGVSLLAGLAYAPHLLIFMGEPDLQVINQLMEMLLFIVVGLVTGSLSAIEKERTLQLEYQLEQVKRLENEVRIADRLAAVGQLASGVAHEIRNPLGIIGAAAQLAKAEDSDRTEIDESLTVILNEVERANRVVSQLLDFARPQKPDFGRIDLLALAKDAVNLVKPMAANKGVSLQADWPSEEEMAEADQELLKQALVNLLLNAIQATPPEGSVTIKIGSQWHEQQPGVLMEITDTGVGIPEDQAARVFDPFYTTRQQGTGLGLSIVHSIIKDHHGFIRIESGEGQGTSVYLWLPARQKEA